jgi:quinohemoprotein ethanol dehydrogenase
MRARAEDLERRMVDIGGGGTVWDSMAYDPSWTCSTSASATARRGTATTRSPGGGDNLYLSSIVALRPDTGEYVWHYQTTPGETGTTPPPST